MFTEDKFRNYKTATSMLVGTRIGARTAFATKCIGLTLRPQAEDEDKNVLSQPLNFVCTNHELEEVQNKREEKQQGQERTDIKARQQ